MLKYFVFLFFFTTTVYSEYILTPMSLVFHSQISSRGVVLTNIDMIKTEINNVRTRILLDHTHENQRLLVDSYRDSIFMKLNQISYNTKMSKKEVSHLDSVYSNLLLLAEEETNVTPELLIVVGDIGTQIMPYKQLATLISIAKKNKIFFEKALELDEEFFPAYIRLATWYYFAPKIGGGDLHKSLEYLNKGEKYAENNVKKFQLYVWRSQVYFRMKQKGKSHQELQKAIALFPYNSWVKRVEKLNQQGKYEK